MQESVSKEKDKKEDVFIMLTDGDFKLNKAKIEEIRKVGSSYNFVTQLVENKNLNFVHWGWDSSQHRQMG